MFAFRFYIWCVCVRASCCSGLDVDTYTYGEWNERAKKNIIRRRHSPSHSQKSFHFSQNSAHWVMRRERVRKRENVRRTCTCTLTPSNAASFNLLYFVVFITISVGFILKELIHVLIRCGMTQITIDFVISSRWPLYFFSFNFISWAPSIAPNEMCFDSFR